MIKLQIFIKQVERGWIVQTIPPCDAFHTSGMSGQVSAFSTWPEVLIWLRDTCGDSRPVSVDDAMIEPGGIKYVNRP